MTPFGGALRDIPKDGCEGDYFICILQDDNVLLICRYLKKVIEDCTSSEDTLKLLRVSTNTLFFYFKESVFSSSFNWRCLIASNGQLVYIKLKAEWSTLIH